MTTIDASRCPVPLEEVDGLGRVGLPQGSSSRVRLRVRIKTDSRETLVELNRCLERPTLQVPADTWIGGAKSGHTVFTVATTIQHLISDAQALSQFGSVKILGERWSDPAGMTSTPPGAKRQKGAYTNRAQSKLHLPSDVRVRLHAALLSPLTPPKPWVA